MSRATLVLLAAGIGSRYGGTKQVDGVGPAGETLLEYAIFDALRAGFDKFVLVIRPEMEDAFRASIVARVGPRAAVAIAHQRLDALPAGFAPPSGRTKPWGTGHALLAAAGEITGPFAVANADDFYGRESFALPGQHLSRTRDAGHTDGGNSAATHALVAFSLRDTLSVAGAVARGVCRIDANGWLEGVTETRGITKDGDGGCYADSAGVSHNLPGDTPTSMNLWAFQPDFLDDLHTGFERFLAEHGRSLMDEFYLPTAVQDAIAAGRARVRVLRSPEHWCGMTHRGDRSAVERRIGELTDTGVYPSPLWSAAGTRIADRMR